MYRSCILHQPKCNFPTIPYLLVDGKLVSDFCKKANIFNDFFTSICTPIDNRSC